MTATTRPAGTRPTRIIGSLREEDGRGVIHIEDVYPTDIDDLWAAVSNPARLARWLVVAEGDFSIGGSFTAKFTSGWEGTGRVDVCEAPHHILVTSFDGDDATVMEATLTTEGDGTRLVIEERGLDLDEYPDHGSGWQAHFEDLGDYLAGREKADWETRWRALTPAYRAMVQ